MRKIVLFLLLTLTCASLQAGDDFCGLRNHAFKAGEVLTYSIFYSVAGIYVNAGTASFTTTLEQLDNKPVYHVVGAGTSNESYDWIFKVRDRYESFFDTATLQPYKFIRKIDEGGHKKYQNVTFNQQTNTAVSTAGTFTIPNCITDVLSAVFYARNINFDSYQPNDLIPFDMFLDNKVYNLHLRYLGKEKIKTKYGKFRSIKFKPLLVSGTIFEGGEKMTVWVSDDPNHIPLRIESPIKVGSIKVDMMRYQNIRSPMTSFLGFN